MKAGAAAAATASIVPRHAVAGSGQTPPSDRLNIAVVGLGWPGCKDCDALAENSNIVALCDVDAAAAPDFRKKYAAARQFQDFRKMFDQMEKSIDAVIVATPDHTHAVVGDAGHPARQTRLLREAAGALDRRSAALMKAAAEHKVVTQLGNQGHSSSSIRTFCEWIWDGAIGNVHTIHAGANAVNSGIDSLADIQKGAVPQPPQLDWDVWLGPAAQRPYHPAYHPFKWRGWTPFGDGTLGDWACHVIDPVFWALDLGAPEHDRGGVQELRPQGASRRLPPRRTGHVYVSRQGQSRASHAGMVQRQRTDSAAKRAGAAPNVDPDGGGRLWRQRRDYLRLARRRRRADHSRVRHAGL